MKTTILLQIATPYSTGTGFYWGEKGIAVTCEHLVRDNQQVIVKAQGKEEQLCQVLFTDPIHDLAFLAFKDASMPTYPLQTNDDLHGEKVHILGITPTHEPNLYPAILLSSNFQYEGESYLLLSEELEGGYAGGALFDENGQLIGMNASFPNEEDYQLGLSGAKMLESWAIYRQNKTEVGTRCFKCKKAVFASEVTEPKCPHCKEYLYLASLAKPYEPVGMARTIEKLIKTTGHPVNSSRRGPNNWQIHQGSAHIDIAYYEKKGLLMGDAHLCTLPAEHADQLMTYLLQQNQQLNNLSFSLQHEDVVLSLIIYDRYLNIDTAGKLFRDLFEQADFYDNILVEKFGGQWKNAV